MTSTELIKALLCIFWSSVITFWLCVGAYVFWRFKTNKKKKKPEGFSLVVETKLSMEY
jgi:hypothetical protein